MSDIAEKLAAQLLVCQDEREMLRSEIGRMKTQLERLRAQLIELERKQKVALDNAYAEGYRAGKNDAGKQQRG